MSSVQFSQEFDRRYVDISSHIETTENSEDLKPVLNDIKSLQKSVSEEVNLPQFDLRRYAGSIRDLVLKYDDKKSSFVNKRFIFKHTPHSDLAEKKSAQTDSTVDISSFAKPTYSDVKCRRLIIAKDVTNLYLKNLTDCVVSTSQAVSSITLEDCESCVIHVKSQTFTFVSNLKGCVLAGSCQQLRVHDTTDSLIAVEIKNKNSHLIIEDCHGLKIGYGVVVDDFSHPDGESPNYKMVDYPRSLEGYLQQSGEFSPEQHSTVLKECIV